MRLCPYDRAADGGNRPTVDGGTGWYHEGKVVATTHTLDIHKVYELQLRYCCYLFWYCIRSTYTRTILMHCIIVERHLTAVGSFLFPSTLCCLDIRDAPKIATTAHNCEVQLDQRTNRLSVCCGRRNETQVNGLFIRTLTVVNFLLLHASARNVVRPPRCSSVGWPPHSGAGRSKGSPGRLWGRSSDVSQYAAYIVVPSYVMRHSGFQLVMHSFGNIFCHSSRPHGPQW